MKFLPQIIADIFIAFYLLSSVRGSQVGEMDETHTDVKDLAADNHTEPEPNTGMHIDTGHEMMMDKDDMNTSMVEMEVMPEKINYTADTDRDPDNNDDWYYDDVDADADADADPDPDPDPDPDAGDYYDDDADPDPDADTDTLAMVDDVGHALNETEQMEFPETEPVDEEGMKELSNEYEMEKETYGDEFYSSSKSKSKSKSNGTKSNRKLGSKHGKRRSKHGKRHGGGKGKGGKRGRKKRGGK